MGWSVELWIPLSQLFQKERSLRQLNIISEALSSAAAIEKRWERARGVVYNGGLANDRASPSLERPLIMVSLFCLQRQPPAREQFTASRVNLANHSADSVFGRRDLRRALGCACECTCAREREDLLAVFCLPLGPAFCLSFSLCVCMNFRCFVKNLPKSSLGGGTAHSVCGLAAVIHASRTLSSWKARAAQVSNPDKMSARTEKQPCLPAVPTPPCASDRRQRNIAEPYPKYPRIFSMIQKTGTRERAAPPRSRANGGAVTFWIIKTIYMEHRKAMETQLYSRAYYSMEDFWVGAAGAAMALVAALVVWEQLGYMRKARHLPGPGIVVPFLGNVVSMLTDPTGFWDRQAIAARKTGLSWNVLFGRFIVFVRDSELSHKIFANVRPDVFHLVGHPFGKKLFGEKNLIFMFGEEHKDLRRRLAPLFTLKALGVYVSIQEKTVLKHIKRWLEASRNSELPIQLRSLCREMNLETSQDVFVGPYLDAHARARFTEDYNLFNVALMKLPVYLPGFAFYKATHAVERLIDTLGTCAAASKRRMASGGKPECLMDFWMVETLEEIRQAEEAGQPPPPHSSDREIGQHVFDFLFASQDASTSSLVWVATLLEASPKVLERVREEQRRVRPDRRAPITPEQLREMKYTEMVVKEVLRFRPPATMVPHIAGVDFPITDSYTVPKGAIVFPSLFESSFQGFKDPYSFDPDRFSPERQEDQVHKRNWLLFGAGPHQCIGQRYALNHLILFTALFSTLADWKRVRTPGCDELMYVPTIVPKDGCLVTLQRHEAEQQQQQQLC